VKSDENCFWLCLRCLDSAIQFLITIVISRAVCSTGFDSHGAGRSVGMISRFRFITLICDFNCLPLFLCFSLWRCEHNQSDVSSSCLLLLGITSFCSYEGSALSAVIQRGIMGVDAVANRTRCNSPASNQGSDERDGVELNGINNASNDNEQITST